ncbi:MAG: hypothetical protein AVDCRST_MAG30-3000, partial [uncultured Solirubrobacteraceae bacterium]
ARQHQDRHHPLAPRRRAAEPHAAIQPLRPARPAAALRERVRAQERDAGRLVAEQGDPGRRGPAAHRRRRAARAQADPQAPGDGDRDRRDHRRARARSLAHASAGRGL